ncbi:N-acetylgalactosamine-6-phosphate deacetylase [Vibrio ponticus]|nr:N-acetylgalactosamine-6-phosphate deacetylase [Vibrio ponticus]
MASNRLSPTHQSYRAQRVLHGATWLNDALITIDQYGIICAIEPFNAQQHNDFIDLGEVSLLPGMIDSHVHGAQGCDVMDASHASLNTMSQYFASLASQALWQQP